MALRIVFLPPDLDGVGCYRCLFPLAYLQARGHEASHPAFVLRDGEGNMVRPLPGQGLQAVPPGDFLVSFFDESVDWDADVLVVGSGKMRWQLDWARKFKARGGRVVVDMDDDLVNVPGYNPGRMDPAVNKDVNWQIAKECCQLADAVTVATEALADLYKPWNENVHVLPNRLHWPMWAGLAPVYERRDWARLRVGYMGGYDFHSADVKLIAKELRLWLRRNPDVEFVAAGDDRFHDLIGVPHDQRVTTAKIWFRNMDLAYVTSSFDIGLVPLVRNRFNEGKSHLKGLEYSACGIVPLVSPTQPYRDLVTDGVTGFLCDRPRDFTDRLDELKADRSLLGRVGAGAYAAARARTLNDHIDAWENIYAGLLSDRDNTVAAGTRTAA